MLRPGGRIVAASLALLVLTGLAAARPAGAEGPGDADFARTGFHLGLGGTAAFQDFDYDTQSLGVLPIYGAVFDPDFDTSAGLQVLAGYRAHECLDLEFQYEWLEGFDSRRGDPSLELDTHLALVNARIFAAHGRWQPYALIGMGALIVNTEIGDAAFEKPYDVDVGFAMRFGGGLEYYLTRHWTLGVEGGYLVPTGHVEDANYGTLGAQLRYRF